MTLRAHRLTQVVAVSTIVLGGLAVAGASPAAAASSGDQVSVSGHGSVKGTPDTLIADMDAHAKRSSASDALSAAGVVATSVIDALEANGVAASDIQTSGVSVDATYGRHGKVTGYQGDESITVRIHPIGVAGQALDAASAAGGNSLDINDTSLTISNKSAFEDQARSKAFAAAKAAAEQYAELAGRQLGRVEQITSSSHSSGVEHISLPSAGTAGAVVEPSAAIPVNPGKQTISTSVRVVWALK
jgi:hypothetical protein